MSILQPAVKKETQKVVVYTVVGVVLMWGVLFLLRPTMPDKIDFCTEYCSHRGSGSGKEKDEDQLFPENGIAVDLGGYRHCGSLFLFRGGNFTAVIPESRDQIYGSY